MATNCPYCGEHVRAVVTMVEGTVNGQDVEYPEEGRGLHCPNCDYWFGSINEVYLNEHDR